MQKTRSEFTKRCSGVRSRPTLSLLIARTPGRSGAFLPARLSMEIANTCKCCQQVEPTVNNGYQSTIQLTSRTGRSLGQRRFAQETIQLPVIVRLTTTNRADSVSPTVSRAEAGHKKPSVSNHGESVKATTRKDAGATETVEARAKLMAKAEG